MPPGLLWGGEKQSQESTAEFQLRGRWMGYNPPPIPTQHTPFLNLKAHPWGLLGLPLS